MGQLEERYISLLTDFGFKRIFGTRPNKDLLVNFLNSMFNGEQVITDVRYLNSEHVGDVFAERRAIFDVYCENERGEKFIVEMQNAYQKHFKDRSLYYATFPIREQAPKDASWNFQLNHVYIVALLNFDLKEPAFDPNDITHDVGLMDKKTFRVFNDKLSFKYVEIANFDKTEAELATLYDKWLFALKNISYLDKRPDSFRERVFSKLFDEAEIARFNPQELHEYEDSLKAYRDIKNSIDTALELGREQGRVEGRVEGRAEGIEQGRAEGIEQGRVEGIEQGRAKERAAIALSMLAKGLDIATVSELTGMSVEEIHTLQK